MAHLARGPAPSDELIFPTAAVPAYRPLQIMNDMHICPEDDHSPATVAARKRDDRVTMSPLP